MSSVSGVASATTGTSVGAGATQWTNPNNVFTSNNTYAVSGTVNSLSTTGSLFVLSHGFSIPSTATIDGVGVAIEAKNALSGAGFRVRFNQSEIFLRYSGANYSPNSPSGVSSATWTGTTEAINVFGGATALWSSTLTPTIVNDASFGVVVKFNNSNASSQAISVDSVIITVYYTEASGVQSSQQFFSRRF